MYDRQSQQIGRQYVMRMENGNKTVKGKTSQLKQN